MTFASRFSRFLFVSSVLSFALTAAACSSSGGSGGAGGSCANYINAIVSGAKECGRFNIAPARENEYLARVQRSCEAALNAPGTGLTASVLDQCAVRTREYCGDDDACEDILEDLRGTLADGAACDVDYQCASGQCRTESDTQSPAPCGKCVPAAQVGQPCPDFACVTGATCRTTGGGSTMTSVCIAERTVAEGEECGDATAGGQELRRCAAGFDCQRATSTDTVGRCTAPAGEGAACGTQEARFARCKPPLSCVNERCGRPLASGQPCGDSNDCSSGLACDTGSKTCAAIAWAAAGASCDENLRRCERGFCFRASTSSGTSDAGTCTDYIADGQPCDAAKSNEQRCDSFSRCVDGTCQFSDPAVCK